jgi:hypothetical protein
MCDVCDVVYLYVCVLSISLHLKLHYISILFLFQVFCSKQRETCIDFLFVLFLNLCM